MNFGSIKDKFDPDSPRAVVWQYTDPYQPRDQPDPDPMLPQTLLVAYEENGRGKFNDTCSIQDFSQTIS